MKTEQNPKTKATKKAKSQKKATSRTGSEQKDAQGVANGTSTRQIKYSKMKEAVEKIKDPQSFEALKHFYNIDE